MGVCSGLFFLNSWQPFSHQLIQNLLNRASLGDSFPSCFRQSSRECMFPCGAIILNIQLNILLQTQAVMSHVRVSRGTGLCLELHGGCKRSAAALAGQHRGPSVARRG